MVEPPRSFIERKRDELDRLTSDVDAWVATADVESGSPYLIPLSFLWDGEMLLFSTPASSPTGRNLRTSGRARLALGVTRDVALIDGAVETLRSDQISAELGNAFAAKTGFDPRRSDAPYLYFRIRPLCIRAWREANELEGRTLMRNGRWLAP